jgi:iduronate 2-sulfatase
MYMIIRLFILFVFSAFISFGASNRPNVLFVISDDLNTALSGYGHTECKTPNLDAFAKTGVSFTRAYCQFPLCAPSRASLMSGQYPMVNGVMGNGGDVDPKRVTLPRHFANNGYWTARVSKIYHMGIPIDIVQGTSGRDHSASWQEFFNITAQETMTPGKLENFTQPDAASAYPEELKKWAAAHNAGKPYKMNKSIRGDYAVLEVAEKDRHLLPDTMAVDKALSLLESRKGQEQPFFLAVGLVRPHFPFVSTECSLRPYDAAWLAYPRFPEDDHADMPLPSRGRVMDFEDLAVKKLRRGYFGAVSFMDQQFGRLMEGLEKLQLRDDTIVVFLADHGYLLGEHQMWKKSVLWEEAIHVPLILSVPGKQRGVRTTHIVELLDLYPTLAELAGLQPDPDAQGQSLVPLLENPNAELPRQDALITVSKGHGLRSGKWAYMWYPAKVGKGGESMLYNMEADPRQFTNLAGKAGFEKIQGQLHRRMLERVKLATQ